MEPERKQGSDKASDKETQSQQGDFVLHHYIDFIDNQSSPKID